MFFKNRTEPELEWWRKSEAMTRKEPFRFLFIDDDEQIWISITSTERVNGMNYLSCRETVRER